MSRTLKQAINELNNEELALAHVLAGRSPELFAPQVRIRLATEVLSRLKSAQATS